MSFLADLAGKFRNDYNKLHTGDLIMEKPFELLKTAVRDNTEKQSINLEKYLNGQCVMFPVYPMSIGFCRVGRKAYENTGFIILLQSCQCRSVKP